MEENKNTDKKSLKFLKGRNTDWDELAKDCVSFANAQGGSVLIGIEDKDSLPPANQKISDRNLPDLIQKNIANRTINVAVAITIEVAQNKAEYLNVQVFRNTQTIACTTDGKYYIRIHDECKPIPPDEMARLAADKNAFVWEEQITKRIPATQFDEQKRRSFLVDVRNSKRVSSFIKEMSDDEILDFYFFQKSGYLTNLGILWIGKRNDRASLLYPPAIQIIRFDDNDEKIWKLLLDDYFPNPKELVERVLNEVPDWQESIEISEGMFRKNSKENGQYHSNWLSMMMPRLYLAKNLLREDGVIFVSIDDNEVHNLRMLMNEIFGEENFVATLVWQKIHSIKNDAKFFSENHE